LTSLRSNPDVVNLSTKASSSAALRSPDDLSNDDDIAVGRRIVLIPGHGLFLRLRWHSTHHARKPIARR
jgi:hypothetical protein